MLLHWQLSQVQSLLASGVSVVTRAIRGCGGPEVLVLQRLLWNLKVELGGFFPPSSLVVSPTSWLGPKDFLPPLSSPVLVTVVYRGPGGSSVFLLSFGSPSPKLLCPLHSGLLKGTCRGTWNLCSHCLTGVSPSTACRCLGPV